jgi:hypothetical protein
MKRLRAWLYFGLFLLVFGILSTARTLTGFYGYFSLGRILLFALAS